MTDEEVQAQLAEISAATSELKGAGPDIETLLGAVRELEDRVLNKRGTPKQARRDLATLNAEKERVVGRAKGLETTAREKVVDLAARLSSIDARSNESRDVDRGARTYIQQGIKEKFTAVAARYESERVPGKRLSEDKVAEVVDDFVDEHATKFFKTAAQKIAEHAEEERPFTFQKFYPRRYQDIGGYHSPKMVAGGLSYMVEELHTLGYEDLGTAMKILLPAMDYMVERKMPYLFIAPKLLDAVKRSDFQDEIDWMDLKLPYEHGCFILPRGALVHPTEGDCICIFWTRIAKDKEYPCKTAHVQNIACYGNNAFGIVAYTMSSTYFDSNLTDAIRPKVKLRNLFYKFEGLEGPDNSTGLLDEPLRGDDKGFLEDVGCIVFGTFLALNARANLLTPAKREKTVAKRGAVPVEYWSPNIIGKAYETKREKTVVGGTSPRMHWRRGHFRNQAYGPRREKVEDMPHKVIWIEPMLIAAPKEEKDAVSIASQR